jgi:hypothetical protein
VRYLVSIFYLKKPARRGEINMNEKENVKTNEQETTTHAKKQLKRYTTENKKDPAKLKETEAGPRESRGKKQRRQFKLAPNRG